MIVQNALEHLADFTAFSTQNGIHIEPNLSLQNRACLGDAVRFAIAAQYASAGRRLFYTSKGYVGIGPSTMQPGDTVCVLCGGITPFILRHVSSPKRSNRRFMLIREVYLHGIMQGEATDPTNGGGLERLQRFEII